MKAKLALLLVAFLLVPLGVEIQFILDSRLKAVGCQRDQFTDCSPWLFSKICLEASGVRGGLSLINLRSVGRPCPDQKVS